MKTAVLLGRDRSDDSRDLLTPLSRYLGAEMHNSWNRNAKTRGQDHARSGAYLLRSKRFVSHD